MLISKEVSLLILLVLLTSFIGSFIVKFLYLMRVVFTYVVGFSLFSFSIANAKPLLLDLQAPSCIITLNGEVKLNTLEEKKQISTFFSILQVAIEQKNTALFLSLFNFSGVTDTMKLELENFVQDFLATKHSTPSQAVFVGCLNKNRIQELKAYGVSFTKEGQQIYTSTKGIPYHTNHPAFYLLDFQLASETDENGDILERGYSIWLGPHDGKFMFTIGTPYTAKMD